MFAVDTETHESAGSISKASRQGGRQLRRPGKEVAAGLGHSRGRRRQLRGPGRAACMQSDTASGRRAGGSGPAAASPRAEERGEGVSCWPGPAPTPPRPPPPRPGRAASARDAPTFPRSQPSGPRALTVSAQPPPRQSSPAAAVGDRASRRRGGTCTHRRGTHYVSPAPLACTDPEGPGMTAVYCQWFGCLF
jgi:hypothetical protein